VRARCGFAIVTVTAKALDGEPPTVHQRPASSGGTAMCCAGCAPRVSESESRRFFRRCLCRRDIPSLSFVATMPRTGGFDTSSKRGTVTFFWFAFGCFARAFSVCHPFVSRFLAWARSGVRRSVPPTSHERIKIPIWWWHRNV
jgi:hypothetical protein